MVPGYDFPHAECIKETEKALLVVAPRLGKEWIPKGQITVDSEVRHYLDRGELCITEWLAQQKGFL